jgi:hypothetical protein
MHGEMFYASSVFLCDFSVFLRETLLALNPEKKSAIISTNQRYLRSKDFALPPSTVFR